MAKKKIKYINGEMPADIASILANADEDDLRILVLMQMLADSNGEVREDVSIENILDIPSVKVDASLKFWRGAGIIGVARSTKKKADEVSSNEPLANEISVSIPTAHRNGAVESNGVDVYGSVELATLIEKRAVTACFVDEAQKVFGKTFNAYDTNIVVGLVDQYGFEEEAVLAILAYVLRLGKKGVKYAEKIALGLYDEGYTTAVEVLERINSIEQAKETIYKIKNMFGFGTRELTKAEKDMFSRWTQTYGYDIDVIRIAYDITVNAIQKPVPKYADKIIEKWYSEGLRTLADVEAYESNKKETKSNGEVQKSYEIDDFFDAALKRSFKDLK